MVVEHSPNTRGPGFYLKIAVKVDFEWRRQSEGSNESDGCALGAWQP